MLTQDAALKQRIDKALDLKKLKLPEKPHVVSLRWEYYEDASSEESLRIWVILADDTADEEITGEAVHAITWAIKDRLERDGVRLFPYISFALESDMRSLLEPA